MDYFLRCKCIYIFSVMYWRMVIIIKWLEAGFSTFPLFPECCCCNLAANVNKLRETWGQRELLQELRIHLEDNVCTWTMCVEQTSKLVLVCFTQCKYKPQASFLNPWEVDRGTPCSIYTARQRTTRSQTDGEKKVGGSKTNQSECLLSAKWTSD